MKGENDDDVVGAEHGAGAGAGVTAMDGKRMPVLSLGTGSAKREEKYNAAKASEWGLLSWIFDNGSTPIIDIFGDASSDIIMVGKIPLGLDLTLQRTENISREGILFFVRYSSCFISNIFLYRHVYVINVHKFTY
ncbi:uncharacterized protein LOC133818569 isoform X2 [Humulus lupulus]|uniref:uncharacterized protein LOC133818569 isoform X2 n=1 Tax=Humulus lupulus TaxID=3486 RepID=UPI002B40F156|nr:uncharacterized protein LOC133818569 isoform X2 [Humulus lupulus]